MSAGAGTARYTTVAPPTLAQLLALPHSLLPPGVTIERDLDGAATVTIMRDGWAARRRVWPVLGELPRPALEAAVRELAALLG